MEQAMSQQDHMSNPHLQQQMAAQQMMLCPVRLVYEAPILMPPGDQMQQMQQNQALYLNPQNPPPWARPVQNQVIYVHQLPSNNIVPMQQHVDPNQLYLQQNYMNYPQVIPQQIVNQNPQEQIRSMPIQIQNVMQPNVMQNYPTNVLPNVQNMTDNRIMGQTIPNYEQQPNSGINIPTPVNHHVNIVQNINNRQVINVGPNSPQIINQNGVQKAVEMQKLGVYRNVVPQINQTHTTPRPLMPQMVMSHVQNLPSQNIPHVNQTFVPNIRQTLQAPQQNVVNTSQNVQQNFVNTMPNIQATDRNVVANSNAARIHNNATTISYSAVRNGQTYTYRAIQPRPAQYRNMPNLLPMPLNAPHPQLPRPTVPNINTNQTSNINITSNKIGPQNTNDDNTNVGRKRKSESPDEIKNKISISTSVYGNMIVTKQTNPIAKKANSSEIGVNTSPVHRANHKKAGNPPGTPQTKALEVQIRRVKEEKVPVMQHVNIPPSNKLNDVNEITDNDKIVRNTVYMQARGRLLNDKQSMHNSINTVEETSILLPDIINKNAIFSNNDNLDIQSATEKMTKVENYVTPDPKFVINLKPSSSHATDDKHVTTPKKEDASIQTASEIMMKVEKFIAKTLNLDICRNPTESVLQTNDMPLMNEISKLNEPINRMDTPFAFANIIKNDISALGIQETNLNTNEIDIKLNESTGTREQATDKNSEAIDDALDKPNNVSNIMTETIIKDEEDKNTINTATECEEEPETRNRKEYQNLSESDMVGKEIHIVDGNIVKENKDYVLTHVLDGYVIQESNVPFAIRKPLKERTLHPNTQLDQQNQDQKQELLNLKDNRKILDLTHLHLNEDQPKDEESDDTDTEDNANPFDDLTQAIVKAWTVEDLSSHLSKYSWTETIQLLQEHEIDGESLFLVSKPQLVTIGISEEHADIIYTFVKS